MNRDEILKMPAGKELDELIAAKVLGARKTNYSIDGEDYWVVRPNSKARRLPRYSHDIALAWEVVERLVDDFQFAINHTGAHWRAMFVPHTTKAPFWFLTHNFEMPKPEYTAWENTAPLAICRAALLVVLA